MLSQVGVGGSEWPPVGQFDLFPLLGVFVALVVVRFALRLTLNIPTTVLAIVAGSAWAWSVETWGWSRATLAGLLLTFVIAAIMSKVDQADRRGGSKGTNAQAD
jgi:hypothetical protein